MKIARNAVVLMLLMTSACSTQEGNKQLASWTGATIGALAGGWVGSQIGGGTGKILYSLGGAMIGGTVGYDTGRSLMVADRPAYIDAIVRALASNDRITWDNPKTGTGGYVHAQQAYFDGNGNYCRNFRATVAFTDDVKNGPGSACQDDTGDWVLVADTFQ